MMEGDSPLTKHSKQTDLTWFDKAFIRTANLTAKQTPHICAGNVPYSNPEIDIRKWAIGHA